MKSLFHFLGSVTFAIFLILTTAFFVILGTVLESKTGSHLYAAQFSYDNPVFKMLLWLLAVNIIVAALRRWPFKKRHTPFLTAHVGLIMILSGTLMKAYFGTQGAMSLLEGSGSDEIVMLQERVLSLYQKNGRVTDLPVKNGRLPENETVHLVGYYPHHQGTYCTWSDGNRAHISGLSPLKFGDKTEIEIDSLSWELTALESENSEEVLHNAQNDKKSKIILIRHSQGEHTLAVVDRYGIRAVESYLPHDISTVVIYDGGFGGYAIQSHIPFGRIDLHSLPKNYYNSAYWAMTLLENLNDETKDQAPWKYLITSEESAELSLIQQMFLVAQDLPDAPQPNPEEAERIQSILARAVESGTHYLETPLTPRFQPLPPLVKLEENLPLIVFQIEGSSDPIPLGFDPHGMGLKWPILNGKYLVHFHPKKQRIPHHVRLREGRQIDYPDSNQPFSYEADLIVDNEEVTLSMNQVHETWDGYRFYLANVSPNDGQSAKRVQLIVNHDPAKYLLTYPGGIIVALGMILLWGFASPLQKKR